MPIHVDVLVHLHERSLNNAIRKMKRDIGDSGIDIGKTVGDRIAKGIRSSSPEVNKALDDVTNAAIQVRRMKAQLKKVMSDGDSDREAQERALEDYGKAVRNYDKLAKQLIKVEKEYQNSFRERADITKQANAALKDFTASHSNHLSNLNKLRAANIDAINGNAQLARSFDSATDAITKASREHDKYNRMLGDSKTTRDQLLRQWNAVSDAWQNEERRIRDATAALAKHGAEQDRHRARQEEHLRRRREKANYSDLGEAGAWAARNLGALTPLGVVTPTLVLPLGVAFTQVANAAVAASQSVALLPAALTAGAATMGTFKLATAGFSDTISALTSGDLEKFAAQIQNLSPNAQQAVLTIQNLLPQLKGLQQATQDAFFADTGSMIQRLVQGYSPMVQQMTTGIAGAMNQAMSSLTDKLLSPGTANDLSVIMQNITASMQTLLPVINPIVDAFVDLTTVGSTFLPGMMQDITGMAQSFANFINEARQSGDLANFMDIGWESLKAVGSAILEIGDMIYEVFGLKSKQDIEDFKQTMSEFTELLGVVLSTLKNFFEDVATAVRYLGNALGPLGVQIDDLGQTFAFFAEVVIGAKLMGALGKLIGMKGLGGASEALIKIGGEAPIAAAGIAGVDAAASKASAAGAGLAMLALRFAPIIAAMAYMQDHSAGDFTPGESNWQHILFGKVGDKFLGGKGPGSDGSSTPVIPGVNAPFDPSAYGATPAPGGFDPNSPLGKILDPGGAIAAPPSKLGAIGGWTGPFPVPPPPPDKNAKKPPWQSTPGTYELSNIPLGTFPGAEWSVPNVQSLYNPPGYSDYKAGKPGTWVTDAMDQQQAAWDVEKKTQDVEEARKRLLELRADNNASEDDRIKQAHNVAEKEQDLIKAQVKQAEAATGKFEKATEKTRDATKGLDDLSAMLDKDLGLSRGLPGLADNLVRFIGALAAAPLLGPLNAMSEALGGKDATGVGLTGILAAQGAFGPKFQIAGYDEKGKPYSLQAAMDAGLGTNAPLSNAPGGVQNLNTGPMMTFGANAPMPSILDDQGSVASGPQSRNAAALIQQMWGSQIRGKIGGSRDNNTAPGTHDAGLSIDIPIGPDQMALGDQINAWLQANKDQLGLKYSIWRDKGVQADGGTFNQPGHQNHIDAHFNGQPGQPAALSGAPGMTGGMPGGIPSGVTPVYVVNMPGGGMGDLMSAAFGGSGNPPGMGNKGGPINGSMASNAQKVVAEGIKRGLPPDVIKAGLAIALQETALGTNPRTNVVQNQNGTPGIQGMFQQDNSYKYDKTNPALAAGGFFDRFKTNGGLAPGVDPWTFAVTGVQKPATAANNGYDYGDQSGAWLRGQWGQQANDFYNQYAYDPNGGMAGANRPGAPVWIPGANGGRGGYFMNGMPVNQDGSPIGGPPGAPAGSPGAPLPFFPFPSNTPPGPPTLPGLPGGPQPQTGGFELPYPEHNAMGFDTGGGPGSNAPGLPPGTTVVQNNTGRTETVVNPQGMVGDKHVSELFPGPGAGNNPFATFNPSNALGIGSSAQAGNKPDGTQYGGAEPATAPGGGQAPTGGGLMGLATSAASMAADAFAPGSGAAVQIGAQVAQRAIKLGGQLAGIGVQGLMETFLPTGASELANNNWLTRIGGAFAGVGPQLPNLAGKAPTPVPNEQPQTLAGFPQPVQQTTNNNTGGTTIVNNLYGVGDVKDTTMNSFNTDLIRGNAAAMSGSMPQKAPGR